MASGEYSPVFMVTVGHDAKIKKGNNGWLNTSCPFPDHPDSNPSFGFNEDSGKWKCLGCNRKGDAVDWLIQWSGAADRKEGFKKLLDYVPSLSTTKSKRPGKSKLPSEAEVGDWHDALMADNTALKFLTDVRHWTRDEIEARKIGLDKEGRYTIPIRNGGSIVNLKRYTPNAPSGTAKIKGLYGHSTKGVFPEAAFQRPKEVTIVLCEGEGDCLAARSMGINAVTFIGGAGVVPLGFLERFRDRKVLICYDADEAGEKGSAKAANAIRRFTSQIKIADLRSVLPSAKDNDLTDLVDRVGPKEAKAKLLEIARAASWVDPAVKNEKKVFEPGLEGATAGTLVGKRIKVKGVMMGKREHPYLVALELKAKCGEHGQHAQCAGCSCATGQVEWMANVLGTQTGIDNQVLRQIRINARQWDSEIKDMVGLACPLFEITETKMGTVEELVLSDVVADHTGVLDLDAGSVGLSRRTAFYVAQHGEAHQVSRSYRFTGTTTRQPWDQAATHVFIESEEIATDFESFEMTPDMRQLLSVFQE